MAQIKMQYGSVNSKPRPIKMDLIKQMQNKQGYTNGTSTGSFTDSQISYDVQASPSGYWEYTVYGKLDISKIKGKTFKVIYNFEDVALPTEINRFNVRIVYSANGNYILPTSPMGGLASGISWCGSNGIDLTTARPTTSGNQQIIQNGMSLFSGVSDDIVDLYIICLYAPQSSQSIRPSGKISIRIEELPSKQYLYKNGNQYTSKTGGYTSNGYEYYNSAGVHRTTVNPTYNSDYVNITSIDNYACIMGTQNKVNIAGYKTLHILYKPNYIYSDAIVIIISTSKELKTTTGVEKLRQLINSTNTNMQELSFDISNINEQCYMVVLNENNSERNINIYEIWLES